MLRCGLRGLLEEQMIDRARYKQLGPKEPLLTREPEPVGHKRTSPGQNVVQRWAKYREP